MQLSILVKISLLHQVSVELGTIYTYVAPRGIYSFIAPFFGLAVFAIRASRLLYNRRIGTTFLLSNVPLNQPSSLHLIYT